MEVSKYTQIFKISFVQEFAYRINFIMWRVRNILGVVLMFYLWESVFSENITVFGYDRGKILTYVFGILVLRAIVFSSRAQDVAGEISRGDILNYFLKPVGYLRYWFARDLSSKVLNVLFSFFEIFILFSLLRPPLVVQKNLFLVGAFLISIILAIILYFCLVMIVNMITFWTPESARAGQYLFLGIIGTFLSGSVFPLDILPANIGQIVYYTPFSYLLFFPLQIYLGKLSVGGVLSALIVSFFWTISLLVFVKVAWKKGLERYEVWGK